MDLVIDVLARTLFLPVLAVQGLHVRRKALILPEAAGDRAGTIGTGPELRLLVLGDSSAAGVGVATQDSALTGQLIRQLSADFRLHWKLDAQTGATTRSTLARLDQFPPIPTDAVVVALGVNDATRGTTVRSWLRRQKRLLDLLRHDYGARRIYVSGVPPLGQFPLLPHPLRWFLGRLAQRLDTQLRQMLATQPDCTYITLDLPMDETLMAEDGFHPGPTVYREWAAEVAAHIARDFSTNAPQSASGR